MRSKGSLQLYLFLFLSLIYSAGYAQNWSSTGGNNERNGLSRMYGPENVLNPYWSVTTTLPSTWGNAVYSFGDRFVTARTQLSPVYIGILECRSLTDGSLLWTFQTSGVPGKMYAVGFNEDAVYVHDYNSNLLFALRPDDGNVLWSVQADMFGGTGRVLFACNGDPVIFGKRLNRHDGSTIWHVPYIIPVGPDAGYAMYGNTYYHYTGSIVTDKQIIAIDAETGLVKYYSDALPGDGDQEIPLTVGPDGRIYIQRDGGMLHCFKDNGTGFTEEWAVNPAQGGCGTYGNIGFDEDGHILTSDGPALVKLNKNTGGLMVSSVVNLVSSGTANARIVKGADDVVYVSNCEAGQGKYFAFTSDLSTLLWELPVPYNYYAGPNLCRNGVFVTAGSGSTLIAYKPQAVNHPPVSDFRASRRTVQAGDTIHFTDQSSYNPGYWFWSFQGGNPAYSYLAVPPAIAYNTPGVYEVYLKVANVYGADSIVKSCYIEVLEATGISTMEEQNNLQLWPNPVLDILHIDFSGEQAKRVSIYSIDGRLILQSDVPESNSLNVSTLPAGLYILEASSEKETLKKSFSIIKP